MMPARSAHFARALRLAIAVWGNPRGFAATLVFALGLSACGAAPQPLLGTLEWDRIGVAAEVSEPILRIAVAEGDQVTAGQVLLVLDARRTQAQADQAQAEMQRLAAELAQSRHGARIETIDSARAAVSRAESTRDNARRERDRARALKGADAVSQEALEQAETSLQTSTADAADARAKLAELLHGTRVEQLDQDTAALASATATAQRLALTLDRLTVRAPRAGRIDALPYKLGDQPPLGATLVSLLAGDAPYARVFVPESQRAGLSPGARFRVTVDGVAASFDASLRSIRAEASFTPYYALSGDDASRLTYRAELLLSGPAAQKLPAGVPLRAERLPDEPR